MIPRLASGGSVCLRCQLRFTRTRPHRAALLPPITTTSQVRLRWNGTQSGPEPGRPDGDSATNESEV